MISLVKIRDRYTGEIQTKFEGSKSIRDRDTIIVDDMISTGNSIINAAKSVKRTWRSKYICIMYLMLCYSKMQSRN